MTKRAKWIVAVALAIIAGLAVATVIQLRPLIKTEQVSKPEGAGYVL